MKSKYPVKEVPKEISRLSHCLTGEDVNEYQDLRIEDAHMVLFMFTLMEEADWATVIDIWNSLDNGVKEFLPKKISGYLHELEQTGADSNG